MGLKFYASVERVKIKSQKILAANSCVGRSDTEITAREGLFAPPSWVELKHLFLEKSYW